MGDAVAIEKPADAPPVIIYLRQALCFDLPPIDFTTPLPTAVPICTQGPSVPSGRPTKNESNADTGNKRKFKYDGGKWTWMLFDTDHAAFVNSRNYLDALTNLNQGHGSGNAFTTAMTRSIRKNSKWSKEFVERYAELLNTNLRPERVNAIIDAMAAEIRTEMPAQIDRWDTHHGSVEEWEKDIADMKAAVENRWSGAVKELQKTFGLSDARMKELFPNGY